MEDDLNKLRNPFLWSKFRDMDREALIDIRTLTPCETPASSARGREGKEEEQDVEVEKEEEAEAKKIDEELEQEGDPLRSREREI